jgi:crotonobetainyl-CoA:carnitine CoA-transferase CaiB-like acyl-CoA transferase
MTPKIADFSTHFSGPFASRQLGDLGADVIKVEHPDRGDGNQGAPPYVDGVGVHHLYLNSGARSLAIDPQSPEWPGVVAAISKWADVVIVGRRPATAARLGIDFASLLRHNENLVYCLISGYGLDGEWADYAAHGLNMDALAGAVPVEWEKDRPLPPRNYRSTGTTLAGLHAAVGILAALLRRDRGLGAQFVHVSIWESALSWQWRDLTTFANTGEPWQQYRDLGSRYSMYRAADDGVILVCPIERHFWERFCDVVGLGADAKSRGDWTNGEDFGTTDGGEQEEVQQRIATRPRDEWVRLLAAADVPVAPVLEWPESMSSDHARANGLMTTYRYRERAVDVPTSPVSVTSAADLADFELGSLSVAHREKGASLSAAPEIGEHTEEVLKEIGFKPFDDKT